MIASISPAVCVYLAHFTPFSANLTTVPKIPSQATHVEMSREIVDVDAMLTNLHSELDLRLPVSEQASLNHRIGALLDQRAVLMRKRDGLARGASLT